LVWHRAQVRLVWAPVSGNPDWAWLKVAGFHARVLWHVPQLVAIAAVWFAGLLWHDAHARDNPPKVFGLVWQRAQVKLV
jgi:hypothetical protein